MKISNSKKELARIISENGGWRDGNYAVQDKDDKKVWFMRTLAGRPDGAHFWPGVKSKGIPYGKVLPNWHQTILSRDEYLHLYPAPDADGWIEWKGGECPVGEGVLIDAKKADGSIELAIHDPQDRIWGDTDHRKCIIAYRLHKTERENPEYCETVMSALIGVDMASGSDSTALFTINTKPTIEQLAADYRNAKNYAECKQQEADAAKADADSRLKALEIAGEAIGLLVSPITKKEPELSITNWRDLRVGDVIELTGSLNPCWKEHTGIEMTVKEVHHDQGAGDDQVDLLGESGCWSLGGNTTWRFIRRP